ncbi:DUF1501 domain-containing protein [Marinicella gelatinilytica]|uniref:DUF1501 domain-containing protein n=1 Tax=Marinicella gelatinilytica TaxID=2996017 RepID=UPI002260D230|nr:DUF1501 domain-containing protein [Marinicella gelatinilytica]MCX7544850.1 DUF1501 domain-containing protein [Marinicella gelatinilytica]
MSSMNRRKFLQSSALLAGLSGVKISRANGLRSSSQPIVIDLFMRGGLDGLNLVPPYSGNNWIEYDILRPDLQVPKTGSNKMLDLGEAFGFHPAATGFRDMYLDGDLAIIHGTGLPKPLVTRSHFDATKATELGTPGNTFTADGWLTRHLQSSPQITGAEVIPVLVSSGSKPLSLQDYFNALTVDQVSGYHPNPGSYEDQHVAAISGMYAGTSAMDQAVNGAMDTLQILHQLDLNNYQPGGGVIYPDNSFGDQLQLIAQLIKEDLNVNVATAELGGWDTHDRQGDGGVGTFADRVGYLSNAVTALWQDLKGSGLGQQVTIVIHSEFGRRAKQNGGSNSGTDHGSGNVMIVIGGRVNGGQMYGQFVGLEQSELFQGEDVSPEVDYRQVLGTIVKEVLGNPHLDQVFPGYSGHQSMNFVSSDLIFANGFDT